MRLKQQGCRLGVVSRIPKRFLLEHLQRESSEELKSSPLPIWEALRRMGVRWPSKAVYLGDMEEDVVPSGEPGPGLWRC